MPILISPNDRWYLSLRAHAKVPQGNRPEFAFRCLSGRQQRELAVKLEAFEGEKSAPKSLDLMFAMFSDLCCGWRRVYLSDADGEPVEVEFDLAKVTDVLSYHQARELLYRVWTEGGPSGEELGFCDSQSNTPTTESASPADAKNA